ncbi:VCBS domain-containing protein [Vibrio chagasii]|nr:VCBS domain-containing protein [Vibrio chagasii]
MNNDPRRSSRAGRRGYVNGNLHRTSADGTEHDITVTINGTNDAPVIGTGDGVDAGEVTEDTSLSTGGTLTISDDDAGRRTSLGANRHGRLIRHVQHRHRWRVDVLSE